VKTVRSRRNAWWAGSAAVVRGWVCWVITGSLL
jgi:hypothetical protein